MAEEIRAIMFGKTGVGKSLLGNNILNTMGYFSSMGASRSVTKEAKRGERMIDKHNKLVLVDTPGLFDTDTNDIMETAKILSSTVKMSKPGPHVFIFVLTTFARFTPEEQAAIEFLIDLFGSHVTDYMIIVFTGKDNLMRNKRTFETYIDEASDYLKNLLSQCRGRVVIDNWASQEEVTRSVAEILHLIKRVYLQNKKKYYTDEMLTEAKEKYAEKLRKLEDEAHKKERELEEEKKQLQKEIQDLLKQCLDSDKKAEICRLQAELQEKTEGLKQLKEEIKKTKKCTIL